MVRSILQLPARTVLQRHPSTPHHHTSRRPAFAPHTPQATLYQLHDSDSVRVLLKMHTLKACFHFSAHSHFAATLSSFPIRPHVFWTYFSALALLAIGLTIIFKNELDERRGIEKILPFGRLFFAIAMIVFGADHLTDALNISQLVPSWMPAHLFWTYLVGVALVAAALSITVKKQARLAAIMLGIMLVLFVLMLHIPNLLAHPRDRVLWVTALRDLAFSAGAFAFAGDLMRSTRANAAHWLVTIGRVVLGVAALFFGVEDFLHPEVVPGVPLDLITPTWIPGHIFWAYVSGAVLVPCGVCLLLNFKARQAAIYAGLMLLVLVVFIYLPIAFSKPSDVDNGLNYVVDTLAASGIFLILADALTTRTTRATSA
jgi:uncharacterized membrane protein